MVLEHKIFFFNGIELFQGQWKNLGSKTAIS